MVAKRAYDEGAKEARRQAILAAADRLFTQSGDQLPSVAEIAQAAGLAKGTVYLYFGAKEDIFATLLLEGWGRAMDAIEQSVRDHPNPKTFSACDSVVEVLKEHPNLMRLDAFGNGMLEAKMTSDALAVFKTAFLARFDRAGAAVEVALELPPGAGVELLTRSHAIARGLWQTFTPARGAGPGAAATGPDAFADTLREVLTQYWRGALLGSAGIRSP